jgi:5-methylcytosine-specific restriction endonuclease McrA
MRKTSWRHAPLPPDWPKIRARVLARDRYLCRLVLPGCKRRATEVHHLDPNDHRDEMLVSACDPCHATETGRANAHRLFRAPRRRAPEPHPGMVPHG